MVKPFTSRFQKVLTPSVSSGLGELDDIAVTHGAEEDYCQCHQSQLHSPCCLPGHAGSPPATRWIRWGGPLPLWDRWIPLLLGQMIPPLSCGTALFLSLLVFHSSGCCLCLVKDDAAVTSPNMPEAQRAITLVVVVLTKGVDGTGMQDGGGAEGMCGGWRGDCRTSGGSTHEAWGGLAGKQGTRCVRRVCCQ